MTGWQSVCSDLVVEMYVNAFKIRCRKTAIAKCLALANFSNSHLSRLGRKVSGKGA